MKQVKRVKRRRTRLGLGFVAPRPVHRHVPPRLASRLASAVAIASVRRPAASFLRPIAITLPRHLKRGRSMERIAESVCHIFAAESVVRPRLSRNLNLSLSHPYRHGYSGTLCQ